MEAGGRAYLLKQDKSGLGSLAPLKLLFIDKMHPTYQGIRDFN